MPSVPAPPAGATTIILNWHWACGDPPPPLDIAGITVCTSCNIAISVRVGSPGNTGNTAQSIVTSTAAAAANVAASVQAAVQAAIPPPAQALIPPSASSLIPDPPVAIAAPPPVTGPQTTYRIDDGLFIALVVPWLSDDLPRHGAPESFGGGSGAVRASGDGRVLLRAHAAAGAGTLVAPGARAPLLHRWLVRRAVVKDRVAASPGRAQPKAPPPVPPGQDPFAPTPFVLATSIAGTHGGGVGVVTALASGLALILLYAISTALRLPPAVPPARAPGANPHPPG
jgi:hypothetical protein